jgi:hypothetical protein
LVLIWRSHYRFSRRYGLEDPYTLLLNLVLLFLVLFYVYPLKFVFTLLFAELTHAAGTENLVPHQASVLMRMYAVGFTSVFLIFVLLYAHAFKLRNALELSPAEVQGTRASVIENLILVLIGASSFALTFKSPAWAGWIYCLIGPALALHGSILGKKTRLLAEKEKRHGAS